MVKIRTGSPKVINWKFSKSVFLSSYAQEKHFRHHKRSKCQLLDSPKAIKCKFSISVFLSSYAQKMDLDFIGSKNQVKVTKGRQVQVFKKCIFELESIEKTFLALWEVNIRLRSPKIIKCRGLCLVSKSLWRRDSISPINGSYFNFFLQITISS